MNTMDNLNYDATLHAKPTTPERFRLCTPYNFGLSKSTSPPSPPSLSLPPLSPPPLMPVSSQTSPAFRVHTPTPP